MNRPVRWYDYITINIYHFGLSMVAQTMTPLVIPLLVQQFVGDASKGTFYGTIRLWSLMAALLSQAVWGIVSDRSTLPWGRRRPFIFLGTLLNLVFMALIGLTTGMEGMTGYWAVFGLLILLQISNNMGQSAQQGLIPDLVPENQRGRFSGVKAVLEIPLPLILVSFTVGRLVGQGNLWGSILVAMGVLLLTMVIAMAVPEKRHEGAPEKINWQPFFRLVFMTGVFTAIILLMGFLTRQLGAAFAPGQSPLTLALVLGSAGFAIMVISVALGVWMSVRVGIGEDARKNSSFTWWVVNRLAFLIGANNLSSFAVYFLQARLNLVQEEAAKPATTLIMLVGIFILLSALPSGWLSDRFGRKRMVAISALVASTGTLIALLSPDLLVIYIGGAIIGTGVGLFFTANWALGTDLVPREKAAQFLGVSNLAGAGAGAIGAYIGGPIADQITQYAPNSPGLGYVVLFSIYGGLFLVSTLALARVSTHREPSEPVIKAFSSTALD